MPCQYDPIPGGMGMLGMLLVGLFGVVAAAEVDDDGTAADDG